MHAKLPCVDHAFDHYVTDCIFVQHSRLGGDPQNLFWARKDPKQALLNLIGQARQ